MISIRNILTITKFESKILWRNWFFRIFAIGILFVLVIFNTAAFSMAGDARNFIIASSWGVPYADMIILSIPQAAAVIFLATGIIKRDKKIDTNEVFLVRPISNIDYVLGKAFAVFKLFFWLNVAILLLGAIYNLTNPLMSFNPMGYIIYPLLMSMSTVVFATGLSFLFVTLMKNQPISIILLIGLSGVVLIYFQGKHAGILDYMSFRFQLMASDISGFSNVKFIVFQRAFYLVAGVSFLFGTAFFLYRLANHRRTKVITGVIALGFAGFASFLMISLWDMRLGSIDLRNSIIEVNGEWADKPNVDILSNQLQVSHNGGVLSSTSKLRVQNQNSQELQQFYFTLNPGLNVQSIAVDGKETVFERNLHVISISKTLSPKQEVEVEISYRGTINEDVAHVEVDLARYDEMDGSFAYAIDTRNAYLQEDYVLLTKDVMWYPDTQIGYSSESTVKQQKAFIDFSLDVQVRPGLTPISQGQSSKIDEGKYAFRPEYALPQISLAIGKYVKKEINVDSINYELYYHPNNDYFSQYFNEIGDTLGILIDDLVTAYEFDQNLKYPFKRLQFVEAPLHFTSYNKIYESNQAFIQPETVYWPEKGGSIREFDFRRQLKRMDEQEQEQNKVMSVKEKQASVFNNLIKKVFTKQESNRWFFDGNDQDESNYSVFPNLYAFSSGIVGEEWPLLNKNIADYLNQEIKPATDFSRNINGISFTEECNQLMQDKSLLEILTEEKEFNKIQKSISLKGEYLFSYLDQLVGEEAFRAFLVKWVTDHKHQLTTYDEFESAILGEFDLDINPVIRQVYTETHQPSFVIENTRTYEILDGDRKRYQVIFDIKNTSEYPGVVKIELSNGSDFNELGFFRRRQEDDNIEGIKHPSLLPAGVQKRYGFVMDVAPEQISVNTLVSRNIPSVVSVSTGKFDLNENIKPLEGEHIIQEAKAISQYEVVVDNEDPGFTTFSPIEDTYLRQFLDKRNPSDKKYYGVWRRSYAKWLATTGSNFYGQSIRSAHFTRAGKGEKVTTWTPELSESGFYDLYVFMMGKNQNSFRRNQNGRDYTYQYIINHGDGKDEINFNLSNAERGWNYLGSYYFSEDGGNVMLTDKCDLRSVYADAVKWVKQ